MPRGKTRSRSTSRPRLGSSGGKTATILSSVSPGKTSSKRQTVCTEKNGKVMCQTVDKQPRNMSPAAQKRLKRKQSKCAAAEEFGLGVCDQEGDLWYNEDLIPEHTEVDENGNVVRMLYVDPEYILRVKNDELAKMFRDVKKIGITVEGEEYGLSNDGEAALRDLNTVLKFIKELSNVELQRVNPDKLKPAYIVTKQEMRHKKMLINYLVCLVRQDAMNDEVENQLGSLYGTDITSFSKRMMEMQVLRRIMDAVARSRVSGMPLGGGSGVARSALALSRGNFGLGPDFLFDVDTRFNFRRVVWRYDGTNSVSMKIPDELSEALREKLLLKELLNASDDDVGKWIVLLLKGGMISGATMSKDLIGMILLYTSVGPDMLGITELDAANCVSQLSDGSRGSYLEINGSDASDIRVVKANNKGTIDASALNGTLASALRGGGRNVDYDAQIRNLNAEISALKARRDSLRDATAYPNQEADVAAADAQIGNINAQIAQINADREAAKARATASEERREGGVA